MCISSSQTFKPHYNQGQHTLQQHGVELERHQRPRPREQEETSPKAQTIIVLQICTNIPTNPRGDSESAEGNKTTSPDGTVPRDFVFYTKYTNFKAIPISFIHLAIRAIKTIPNRRSSSFAVGEIRTVSLGFRPLTTGRKKNTKPNYKRKKKPRSYRYRSQAARQKQNCFEISCPQNNQLAPVYETKRKHKHKTALEAREEGNVEEQR